MRLSGKVGLITGAASGFGKCTALRFAEEGAAVAVTDLLVDEGNAVVAEIESRGGKAIFIPLDVTDERAWASAVEIVTSRFGRLDILVNNAGISGGAGNDSLDVERWDLLMSVNAKSALLGIRQAIPALKQAGGGSIINISSISGVVGQKSIHVGYNASKGAVRTLSKVIAVQYGADNIRCNSVHPGIMPPMRSAVRTANPEWRAALLQNVPLQRAGEAIDVANAILFLASDEASYITGSELIVDGGYLAV